MFNDASLNAAGPNLEPERYELVMSYGTPITTYREASKDFETPENGAGAET
jgi:hypothetical protein